MVKPVIRYWLLGKGKLRSEATNVLDVQRSMFPAAVGQVGSVASYLTNRIAERSDHLIQHSISTLYF
jgi:hypothetical protein